MRIAEALMTWPIEALWRRRKRWGAIRTDAFCPRCKLPCSEERLTLADELCKEKKDKSNNGYADGFPSTNSYGNQCSANVTKVTVKNDSDDGYGGGGSLGP